MKKVLMIGIPLLVVVSLVAVWFKISSATRAAPVVSDGSQTVSTKVPVALATWKDTVGFTFQYPEGLIVDKHDEDKENYAHVELTDANYPGSVIVWLKDVPKIKGKTATDLSAWVENEAQFTGGTTLDTKLGSIDGKKILVTSPARKLYAAALYDDLLYLVEATPGEDGYWQDVFDTITRSFVLHPVISSSDTSSRPMVSDQMIVDEEEVIE